MKPKTETEQYQLLKETIEKPEFPCIFAQAAFAKETYTYREFGQLSQEKTAAEVCQAMYEAAQSRAPINGKSLAFPTFIAAFSPGDYSDGATAAKVLFTLFKNMRAHDIQAGFEWASGVSNDVTHELFSFSIGGEAYFIPFFFPFAIAPARKTAHTYLVFNSHQTFEVLRQKGLFDKFRKLIRERQIKQYGKVPELLCDFAQGQEFPQYFLPEPEDLGKMWQIFQEVFGGNLMR